MSDEREFKIRITGDASSLSASAGQAQRSLGEVKSGLLDGVNPAMVSYGKASEQASEGAEHMHVSHRALRSVLHGISPELAHIGHLLMIALHNPMLSAAAGGVVLNEVLTKMREHLVPDTSEMGIKSLAPGFDAARSAIESCEQALLEWHSSLNEALRTERLLNIEMEHENTLLEAQKSATQATDDAEKKLALAKLALAKASGTITGAQYEEQKSQIEQESEQRKFEREKAERDQKVKNLRTQADATEKAGTDAYYDADKAAGKLEDKKTDLAHWESVAKTAEENNKKYKEESDKRVLTPEETKSWMQSQDIAIAARSRLPELRAEVKKAEDDLRKLQEDAKNLPQKAQELRWKASSTEEANATWEDGQKKALATNAAAHATEAQAKALSSPEGKLIRDVSTAEAAAQHGQKLTVKQQAQIATLEQMLEGHGVNAQLTLQLLGRLHGNQQALNRQMQDILKKIENSHNDGT